MSATFYLCASHHSRNRAGQELLREITRPLGRGFRACHVGCFHDDDRKWAKVTTSFLESLGARCSSPRLSDPKVDIAAARVAIEEAEFLYLDGGDTVAGVGHIRARGLLDAFERAAQSAQVIFGLSGGACAAAPYTIGYDGREQPYVAPCLGIGAPLPLDVHDEQSDWAELRALLALRPKRKQGIVLPTNAVLRVGPRGGLDSHAEPACEIRSLATDGSWRVERI
ncbi:MAG: Type 1 glutamine amidotransferase-like domain-containing protein [Planctomycetes bacterium]|nr:Type 1 glutamine amidotransferase-like domain-containing protein [Planctomycetota bacterium]